MQCTKWVSEALSLGDDTHSLMKGIALFPVHWPFDGDIQYR